MPGPRGNDNGGRDAGPSGSGAGPSARGRGRGRGRGVKLEEGSIQVAGGAVRGANRRGAGRARARGGRGQGVHERSLYYVGDIMTSEPEASTVHVGIALEQPLITNIRKRKLVDNVPDPALEVIIKHESDLDHDEALDEQPLITNIRKRKQVDNVQDPELEDITKHGSDLDDDEDFDEGDDVGCVSSLWNEQIFYDSFENFDGLASLQPSSSLESTWPPSSTPAPSSAQSSSSAPVSVNETTFGPQSLCEFEWRSLPVPAISPLERRERFTASAGPVSAFSSPYETFVSIWDRSIMEYIAAETNRYAEQTLQTALCEGSIGGHSRLLQFTDTNADELYVFFALIIATGVVFKSDLTEYWSVNEDVFDTPNFSHYMTYTRFQSLSTMLHFFNNEVDISHLSKAEAKIAKIAPIVKHLNEKFQAFYQLGQCIALDESLTQWKGCLSINQLIKNKAATKGIKTYEVCDSHSGYLWRMKIHAGRNDVETNELGYITPLVLELLEGLENKGHTVFMDSFYNSPLLARILKSRGFDCVGTLRPNRLNVPAELKALVKQPLAVGSVHGATSGDVDVLVWKDRNVVTLITTYHGAASASRDGKVKPTLVHDYNVRMGGVDKKDQMLSAYPIERKRTAVWYKKFFRRLLNISVLNAFILHKESPAPKRPHPHFTKHRQFRKELVKTILAKHCQRRRVTLEPVQTPSKVKFSAEMLRHLPVELPYNEKLKQRRRRSCAVCHKRTVIQCIGCNVALCLGRCFAQYHS